MKLLPTPEVKFKHDPTFETLEIPDFHDRDFEFFDDETIQGVAFIVKEPHPTEVQGLYFALGPRSHENLRQNCLYIGGTRVPIAEYFGDPTIEFGFYTNRGRFFNRRATCDLVYMNNLTLADPNFSARDGLLSTNVWKLSQ